MNKFEFLNYKVCDVLSFRSKYMNNFVISKSLNECKTIYSLYLLNKNTTKPEYKCFCYKWQQFKQKLLIFFNLPQK